MVTCFFCLAFEIFDDKRSVSSPPAFVRAKPAPTTSKINCISIEMRNVAFLVPTHARSKSNNHSADESSISEEPHVSHKSSR